MYTVLLAICLITFIYSVTELVRKITNYNTSYFTLLFLMMFSLAPFVYTGKVHDLLGESECNIIYDEEE